MVRLDVCATWWSAPACCGCVARDARCPAGFRMPWWPLPPILLAVGMLLVCVQTVRDAPVQIAISVVTLLVGVAYYYGFIHPRRGERWTLPDPVQETPAGG